MLRESVLINTLFWRHAFRISSLSWANVVDLRFCPVESVLIREKTRGAAAGATQPGAWPRGGTAGRGCGLRGSVGWTGAPASDYLSPLLALSNSSLNDENMPPTLPR